jgi:putative addiction module component (TIGR02574 family)
VAVAWPTTDDVRVDVFANDGDPRLAATVELVSPRYKDRRRSREMFAAKCTGYLGQGCGLVVVDAVTSRRADLHGDLLAAPGADARPEFPALSAVSYRSVGRDEAGRLLAWPATLEVGKPLPTVPLWLGADLAVPLDLEASHTAACADLRIRLVQDVWDRLVEQGHEPELSDERKAEIDGRMAAHAANPEAAIPWEQVEAEALARLRR